MRKAEPRFSPFEASLWFATAEAAPATRELEETITADVCIVGAGYTGLTTALELARKGVSVVVVEAQVLILLLLRLIVVIAERLLVCDPCQCFLERLLDLRFAAVPSQEGHEGLDPTYRQPCLRVLVKEDHSYLGRTSSPAPQPAIAVIRVAT